MGYSDALRTVDLGYLAGIIDGEGSIILHPSRQGSGKRVVRVNVNMTDRDILERCQSITQMGGLTGPYARGTNKPIWFWSVNRQKDVASLLMTLYPLLGERRQAKTREALLLWRSNQQRKTPEPYGVPGENGCGTYAGWAAHYRRKETPCRECMSAKNRYRRERRGQ